MDRASQLRRWVELLHQTLGLGQHGVVGQIDLVQQHQIGLRQLRPGLRRIVELPGQVTRIGHTNHAVDARVLAQQVVKVKSLHHRCRIGQAGGLDDDAVKAAGALQQVARHADQVTAQLAADAAIVQLVNLFFGANNERPINTQLAVFIHDHGIALALSAPQQAIEQGGLARAQKAGQHSYGNGCH